jgi:hypothetical protein
MLHILSPNLIGLTEPPYSAPDVKHGTMRGKYLASFEMQDEDKVINAIERDRFDDLKKNLMRAELSKPPCLVLKVHLCLNCHNENPLLELSRLTVGDKGIPKYKRCLGV